MAEFNCVARKSIMAQKKSKTMPPAMILCGGKGTRLRDISEVLPKPMVTIGEQPIVWHIMKCYAAFGVRRFILCLGYKREAFVDYFVNYHLRTSDATVTLGHDANIRFHEVNPEADWEVTLAGTGVDTCTGLRVAMASKYLRPEDKDFFLTYGDGVADIDVDALYAQHLRGRRLLTLSAVHPAGRFGQMLMDGDKVVGFEEKPLQGEGYINGGFMVMNRGFVKKYLPLEKDVFLEKEPFQNALANKDMQAYRHEGFWQCMDNSREYHYLNELWSEGNAPWTRHWRRKA